MCELTIGIQHIFLHNCYDKTIVADPGCFSRITDPEFDPSRIPDPITATNEEGEKIKKTKKYYLELEKKKCEPIYRELLYFLGRKL